MMANEIISGTMSNSNKTKRGIFTRANDWIIKSDDVALIYYLLVVKLSSLLSYMEKYNPIVVWPHQSIKPKIHKAGNHQ
jgi:hypothetical protein